MSSWLSMETTSIGRFKMSFLILTATSMSSIQLQIWLLPSITNRSTTWKSLNPNNHCSWQDSMQLTRKARTYRTKKKMIRCYWFLNLCLCLDYQMILMKERGDKLVRRLFWNQLKSTKESRVLLILFQSYQILKAKKAKA